MQSFLVLCHNIPCCCIKNCELAALNEKVMRECGALSRVFGSQRQPLLYPLPSSNHPLNTAHPARLGVY